GDEQANERARRTRSTAQRIDNRHQPKAASGLAQIAEPGPQPDDGLRLQAGIEHELVELVVLGGSAEDIGNRTLDGWKPLEDRINVRLTADLDAEIVNVTNAPGERGRHFLEHAEAEILEHRHRVRQRDQSA